MGQRIWLIDVLRSGAILLMILYHFLFDLEIFYGQAIGLFESQWIVFRMGIAGLFIFLAGYSLTLSHRPFWQGGFLLSMAIIVTIVSFWYTPYATIYFGILHMIGISYLLGAWFFKKVPAWLNGIFGVGILLSFGMADKLPLYLLPLGGGAQYLDMMDYYPLSPWLGIFLWGLGAGQVRLFSSFVSEKRSWYLWPGRHSLLIYIIHQPILLGALYLYYGR